MLLSYFISLHQNHRWMLYLGDPWQWVGYCSKTLIRFYHQRLLNRNKRGEILYVVLSLLSGSEFKQDCPGKALLTIARASEVLPTPKHVVAALQLDLPTPFPHVTKARARSKAVRRPHGRSEGRRPYVLTHTRLSLKKKTQWIDVNERNYWWVEPNSKVVQMYYIEDKIVEHVILKCKKQSR